MFFFAGWFIFAEGLSGVKGLALATRAWSGSCALVFPVEDFFLGPGTGLGLTTSSSFSRTGITFIPGSIIGILSGSFAGTEFWEGGGG